MAIDRERRGIATIITRITYSKPGPDLLKRTKLKIKDADGITHVIFDDEVNVGRKQDYKKSLVDQRKGMEDEREQVFDNDIDFLNEQIADIEAL